jgi:hypothetical protein
MTLTSEPGLAGGRQPDPYQASGPYQAPSPGRGDGLYETARPDQGAHPYLAAGPDPADGGYPGSNGAYAGSAPAQAAGPPTAPAAPAVTIQTCWMCGIRLPATLMVPDGGEGCPDIRWYCQDARQCTERWTSHRPPASI